MSLAFDGAINELQQQSRNLAKSSEARQKWLQRHHNASEVVQEADKIWTRAIDQREISGGLNEDGKLVENKIIVTEDEQLQRATVSARILRNVVVGDKEAQKRIFEVVSLVITKLWKCTSFAYINDEEMHTLTRTYVQLLSNLITGNNDLQNIFWQQHLSFNEKTCTARSGADLLGRLLQSRDTGTSTAAQILLLNCTLESRTRCDSLANSMSGKRILEALLAAVREHIDNEKEENEEVEVPSSQNGTFTSNDSHVPQTSSSKTTEEFISLSFTFFSKLFDRHLFGRLYTNLQVSPASNDPNPLVTHPQLTLLKLLDSYLHLGANTYGDAAQGKENDELLQLIPELSRLSRWAEAVMNDSLKVGSRADIDNRLVDVHVGLILHLQILISLGLKIEESNSSDTQIGLVAKEILSEIRKTSFIEMLVSLLHTLGQFSPAISPFRSKTPEERRQTAKTPPQGHFLSSTGLANLGNDCVEGPSLDNLKRDIVNLLGVLAYERGSLDKAEVRRVQDTVRESGGLIDVLSMTQLDERNPYIRERAIFTLRALLQGNQLSQDFIAQIKPIPQPAA